VLGSAHRLRDKLREFITSAAFASVHALQRPFIEPDARPCCSYSITSSARVMSDGGTSRPSAVGGLEFDDQLEFGRCSIGKSPLGALSGSCRRMSRHETSRRSWYHSTESSSIDGRFLRKHGGATPHCAATCPGPNQCRTYWWCIRPEVAGDAPEGLNGLREYVASLVEIDVSERRCILHV